MCHFSNGVDQCCLRDQVLESAKVGVTAPTSTCCVTWRESFHLSELYFSHLSNMKNLKYHYLLLFTVILEKSCNVSKLEFVPSIKKSNNVDAVLMRRLILSQL